MHSTPSKKVEEPPRFCKEAQGICDGAFDERGGEELEMLSRAQILRTEPFA